MDNLLPHVSDIGYFFCAIFFITVFFVKLCIEKQFFEVLPNERIFVRVSKVSSGFDIKIVRLQLRNVYIRNIQNNHKELPLPLFIVGFVL